MRRRDKLTSSTETHMTIVMVAMRLMACVCDFSASCDRCRSLSTLHAQDHQHMHLWQAHRQFVAKPGLVTFCRHFLELAQILPISTPCDEHSYRQHGGSTKKCPQAGPHVLRMFWWVAAC